jgi:SAM-dependent methyltransferase
VPASSYNQIPYQSPVKSEIHPARLAAVGRLCGMQPAPVDACRYLEIGCGDAGNLIGIAYYLPKSQFVGVDLAEVPIAAGEQMRSALAIDNLTLRAADLRDISAGGNFDYAEFDYIVAHGVYSWVPAEVRDALLRVCRERLAPHGIAFISYNTLPGRFIRQYLRDLMRFHTRGIEDPSARLRQARWSVQYLADSSAIPQPWRPLLESEIAGLLQQPDWWLIHDDFGEINHPVYFHQFVDHAARHGLQYLGDADPACLFDPHGRLKPLSGSLVERQQYLDFLQARRFRQTLLCHQGEPLLRAPLAECLDRFLFSAPSHPASDGTIEGLRGMRIQPADDAVRHVAAALAETYPLPLTFEELVPYAAGEAALRDILAGMVTSGFADFHVYPFACQEQVLPKPAASRLARYQAAAGSRQVTNACGHVVALDEIAGRLLPLLDGTRTHRQIARDLARTPGTPPLKEIARHLAASLEWLARVALLE